MSNYGIEDIKHLDTKEAMRNRIQVYLGSDDTEGIYQSLKEIINNSTDEALAGFGNKIEITVDEKKNEVQVRDWGRGVPFGEKDGKNILVAIYTESHTGGKFNKDAYKNSSGLNGIGGTAVCMSSSCFTVQSIRGDFCATAQFKKGDLVDYKEEKTKNLTVSGEYTKNGTNIIFSPDKEVFKNMTEGFSFERICEEIRNISYLNRGIRFIINSSNGETKEFFSENGIVDFIKDNIKKPLMKNPIFATAEDGTDKVEIAFMWTGSSSKSYIFVNGLYCPEGGSPVTGAKTTLTTSIKRLAGKDFDSELIRKGLVYVINCTVADPSFANQTKTKINNPNLRTLTSKAFKEGLEEFSNTAEFSSIVEMMNKFEKAEKAADKAREAVMNHTKKMSDLRSKKVAFITKLSDAEELGEDATLCIVEGDSASNAALIGRDSKKYGVMQIRGKMLNSLKASEEKIFGGLNDKGEKIEGNKEIELLLYALGIDVNNYNKRKLRYGKIAIFVDGDVDGDHIGLLILCNMWRLCPQFVKENRISWLRAPLYIEQDKKENPVRWWYDDAAFNKDRNSITGNIKRAKGLGALSESDLKATCFSTTGGQLMDQIEFSEEGIEQLCSLMGTDIAPRKEFIMNIDFSDYGAG